MQEVRKALMGHSSGEDVHATYVHVELPHKREAIRKLEEWVRQQRKQPEGGIPAKESEERTNDRPTPEIADSLPPSQ